MHSKFHTPYVAIIVYSALVFAFASSGAFRVLAVLATISQLVIYFTVCLAVLQRRRVNVQTAGAFRAPGGPIVPIVGMAAVLWLLSHSTRAEVMAVTALVAMATVYYIFRTRYLRGGASLNQPT